MNEAPRIDITLVPSDEKPGGIGEPATALLGPAMANALHALTGKRYAQDAVRRDGAGLARRLWRKARFGGLFLLFCACTALAQDYSREKRWADDILFTLMDGEAVWLEQANGHRFLSLFIEHDRSRPALIIAHGRGWSPDYELYGTLRTRLAALGYTTLSIQLPVLPSTAILGLYVPLYPDARERFQLAVDFLKAKGYRDIAIVSHSLGATMANQYLIRTEDSPVKAWCSSASCRGWRRCTASISRCWTYSASATGT